jgi:hypothetical protein
MTLYSSSGVSVESWVEIEPDSKVVCELDKPNNGATLYFGHQRTFVLNLSGTALRELAVLSNYATLQLDTR